LTTVEFDELLEKKIKLRRGITDIKKYVDEIDVRHENTKIIDDVKNSIEKLIESNNDAINSNSSLQQTICELQNQMSEINELTLTMREIVSKELKNFSVDNQRQMESLLKAFTAMNDRMKK